MNRSLQQLITEAQGLAGDWPCASQHDWESTGGRRCPTGNENCSQVVVQCKRCGEYDYGEKGGPAHQSCVSICGPDLLGWKHYA